MSKKKKRNKKVDRYSPAELLVTQCALYSMKNRKHQALGEVLTIASDIAGRDGRYDIVQDIFIHQHSLFCLVSGIQGTYKRP